MAHQGFYGSISDDIWNRAKKISLLICDIDGVFSDGRVYLGNNGEELKAFHARDGYGIKALLNIDVNIAVITARKSKIVEHRMTELGITDVYQGAMDKCVSYNQLKQKHQLAAKHIAYIGDDIIDIPVMKQVGLAVAVADAHPYVNQFAHMITHLKGGNGALRELIDLIILSQNKFDVAHGCNV